MLNKAQLHWRSGKSYFLAFWAFFSFLACLAAGASSSTSSAFLFFSFLAWPFYHLALSSPSLESPFSLTP